MKTYAVRLPEDLHHQIRVLAAIQEITVSEFLRLSAVKLIETLKENPEVKLYENQICERNRSK
jgi:hypothetical protein